AGYPRQRAKRALRGRLRRLMLPEGATRASGRTSEASFEGEAPAAYAAGGGDASPVNCAKRALRGRLKRAYACGGGDASPNNCQTERSGKRFSLQQAAGNPQVESD